MRGQTDKNETETGETVNATDGGPPNIRGWTVDGCAAAS
jgi:hypothetical protein